jgi:CCAAT-binding transcription factor (CBF-B/NF-YA) subunit B
VWQDQDKKMAGRNETMGNTGKPYRMSLGSSDYLGYRNIPQREKEQDNRDRDVPYQMEFNPYEGPEGGDYFNMKNYMGFEDIGVQGSSLKREDFPKEPFGYDGYPPLPPKKSEHEGFSPGFAYIYNENSEQPLFVNVKQYSCIKKRKKRRDYLDSLAVKRPEAGYLHESRHKHAMKRPRAPSGRFLTKQEAEKKRDRDDNL